MVYCHVLIENGSHWGLPHFQKARVWLSSGLAASVWNRILKLTDLMYLMCTFHVQYNLLPTGHGRILKLFEDLQKQNTDTVLQQSQI